MTQPTGQSFKTLNDERPQMSTELQDVIATATVRAFNSGVEYGRKEGFTVEQIAEAIRQAKLYNEVGEFVYTEDFWEFLNEQH